MQSSGFEPNIYDDKDAALEKEKDTTRKDCDKIMDKPISETGLEMTLEFHYKFLGIVIHRCRKNWKTRKHYYGLTFENQLITRGKDAPIPTK